MGKEIKEVDRSGEAVSFWRSRDCLDLEFLEGRYTDHVFMPHAHDRYLFGLITSGAIEIVDPKRRAVATAGQLVLYNHDQVHWGHAASSQGWAIQSIYIPPSYLHETARELDMGFDGTIGFQEIAATNSSIAQSLSRLFDTRGEENTGLASDTLLLELAASVLVEHADSYVRLPQVGAEPNAVRIAREYLGCNFKQNISLAELSAECGIGRYWLIKAFKSAWGITPYGYVSNKRIRHAMSLLRLGVSIVDVAVTCGFADQSHLTRVFKRSLGVTPGRFQLH